MTNVGRSRFTSKVTLKRRSEARKKSHSTKMMSWSNTLLRGYPKRVRMPTLPAEFSVNRCSVNARPGPPRRRSATPISASDKGR